MPKTHTYFQSFEENAAPQKSNERLQSLRQAMQDHSFDAYLIPRSDAHQSEFLSPASERLAWLTGFTGTAGFAIVTQDQAAIFIDGRYTIQVQDQVDTEIFQPQHLIYEPPEQWLEQHIKTNEIIGYDPWLHSFKNFRKIESVVKARHAHLKPLSENLIDGLWHDQPKPPSSKLYEQPIHLTGRKANEKVKQIAEILQQKGADYLILNRPESIAWTLNIRNHDVPRTPAPLCFALIGADQSATLFIDDAKCDETIKTYLQEQKIILSQPDQLLAVIQQQCSQKKVMVDPAIINMALIDVLKTSKAKLIEQDDPVEDFKVQKTPAEITAIKKAHLLDGIAFCRFLYWLEHAIEKQSLDEITIVKQLENCRQESGALKDIAFDTICGSGSNGAIVHYRVNEKTNRTLQKGELLLLDSGAQYQEGTTDITRTLPIGTVDNPEIKKAYTLVLKGHIALASLQFPEHTNGAQLDGLARHHLWAHGMDYDHGTGHGVGAFLGVHEGPVIISKNGKKPLKTGMILSNEPGFYSQGSYGIRIENLVLVQEKHPEDQNKPMMCFETLTLAPINKSLIDESLLTQIEIKWLNNYHQHVYETLKAELDEKTRNWLQQSCQPV